jgi:hypothetical protein
MHLRMIVAAGSRDAKSLCVHAGSVAGSAL